MKELTHFIRGKHANGTSVRFCDGFEPMTGEVILRVPLASKAEVCAQLSKTRLPRRPPGPLQIRSAVPAS